MPHQRRRGVLHPEAAIICNMIFESGKRLYLRLGAEKADWVAFRRTAACEVSNNLRQPSQADEDCWIRCSTLKLNLRQGCSAVQQTGVKRVLPLGLHGLAAGTEIWHKICPFYSSKRR